MLKKKVEAQQQELGPVSIEALVGACHWLQKIDGAVDFSFIHEQVEREVEVTVACGWFPGLRLGDKVPDASTLGGWSPPASAVRKWLQDQFPSY